ncbi:MAG: Fe-S protein maturation auxiliary factor SufT [Gammaproteobacteria bacterium]|nr:Fe-S protein maturation auxiliary factor SufT [Gammaproteobacteria bacterium]
MKNALETGIASAGEESDRLDDKVIEALKTVYDPEIPVNIYDLGLIYDLRIDREGVVDVDMTLTAPGCPVAEYFPSWVADAVECVDGVSDVRVEIVWDPPWTPERMSEEAKLELGFM